MTIVKEREKKATVHKKTIKKNPTLNAEPDTHAAVPIMVVNPF